MKERKETLRNVKVDRELTIILMCAYLRLTVRHLATRGRPFFLSFLIIAVTPTVRTRPQMAAKQTCSDELKVDVLRYEVFDWSSYSAGYHPRL